MKISVIITTFNIKDLLPKAIESFLVQDYQDKELLIVDDISTDGTHDVIKSYQEKYPKVIKWIKEKDNGISQARNIALNHVSGDIVGFLGGDDFLHKDFFSNLKYYLETNPNFDVVYFNSYTIGVMNGFSPSTSIPVTTRNLIKHCPIGSGESFYYKTNLIKKFKFNEKSKYCMDYELNMAIASSKERYKFYPVNISAVFNFETGTNNSTAYSLDMRLETIAVQLKYARNFIEKFRIILRSNKLIRRNIFKYLKIKDI